MKKQKFDEDVVFRAKALATSKGAFYQRDVDDTDMARSAMSGFGFDSKDRQFRGELKPEVTVPILDSWINQTTSAYTAAPFGLGLKSPRDLTALRFVFDKVQEDNALTDLVSTALTESLTTGMAYFLVSTALADPTTGAQDIVISTIDSRKVMCDISDDAELDDCQIACVIEVMQKRKATTKYNLEDYDLTGSVDTLAGMDIGAIDTRTQCSVLTVYEKMDGGVQISKIVGGKVVAQHMAALSRIPLVRVYCDECWIEKELHFRGIYHKVVGLWKMMNYGISEVQARIARAKQADWMVDGASIAKDPDDWAPGSDAAVLKAESWNGEKELRAPMPIDKTLGLAEPLTAVQSIATMIRETLGGISGEGRGVETAEAVLARKAVAEASVSKYLANLKKSLKSLGRVVLDYIAICYDIPRSVDGVDLPVIDIEGATVTVDGGPSQASQRQKTLQQVLMISDMSVKSGAPGVAAKILPTVVGMSDIPDEIKQQLAAAVQTQPDQLPPQVIQAMQQKDQQMGQMQQALAESQKTVAALQTQLSVMLDDTQNKYRIAVLDNQTKIMIERMKLAANDAKLQAQIQADFVQQQQEIQADIAKETLKLQAQAPTVPVFDAGRFV